MPQKILVTGGAGFIGSHVVEEFLAKSCEVEVLDDLTTGKRKNLTDKARLHEMDVASPAARALVKNGGFDFIAHLAAQIDVRKSTVDPLNDARINILGALNLLEGIRDIAPEKRPRLVFSSTGGALYGDFAAFPTPESSPANPDSPYGVAKLSAEYYMGYYARVWGLRTTVLRFGNVYGPRQDPHGEAGVIAIFARRILEGKTLTIYGDGTQTRDYAYVGDVASAFASVAAATDLPNGPLDSRAFNIGTGIETSVLDLVRGLSNAAGKEAKVEHAPARPGELARSMLDPTKAAKVLQWRAAVSLADGLTRTLDWMRS